jgi:hypothetical protein
MAIDCWVICIERGLSVLVLSPPQPAILDVPPLITLLLANSYQQQEDKSELCCVICTFIKKTF